MVYVLIIGAFQSFIGLLLFLEHKRKEAAYSTLMWILICICAHLSIKFIIYVLVSYHELQIEFTTFLNLTYGPLLYLYVRQLAGKEISRNKRWIHLVPGWIGGFFYTYIVIDILANRHLPIDTINVYNRTLRGAVNFSWTIYPALSLAELKKMHKPGYIKEKSLAKFIAYSLGFLSVLIVVTLIIIKGGSFENAGDYIKTVRTIDYSLLFMIAFSIVRYYYRVQMAMNNRGIFSEAVAPKSVIDNDTVNKGNLDKAQQASIIQKLISLMEDRKLYLDMELTLEKLAAESGTSRHHISESLNNHLQKSFYLFINEYRIQWITQHLDKCMENGTVPNLLTLAYEAGFKSKSSFNQYFKKIHGSTPSEYMATGRTEA